MLSIPQKQLLNFILFPIIVPGIWFHISAQPPAAEANSLIEKETTGLRRLLKSEFRISNIEGMYSARREPQGRTIYFFERTERIETTLRNSAVRYSLFCGSLYKPDPTIEAVDLTQIDTSTCGVSYEVSDFRVNRYGLI